MRQLDGPQPATHALRHGQALDLVQEVRGVLTGWYRGSDGRWYRLVSAGRLAPAPMRTPAEASRLAGVLSDERVAEHMRNRALRLDGVVVTDLDLPAPAGTRIVIAAPEV